ncbi:MAG: hypothetical protein QG635_1527 [Bacteroidota bacterium]|nr:hypothetical protein [Bacteroidota bacterium]
MENNAVHKLPASFDEAFKILIASYFGRFARVETDYEIIDLPKRVDILVVEQTEPIEPYVVIFKYFKRFNIIEFKSEGNKFRLNEDLYKLGIYINGVLMKEPEADVNNSTFTLVTSIRPAKFLKQYKAREIRQGLYIIGNISVLPVYVVVADELELRFEKEISYIKGLTSRKKRTEYLKGVLKLKGNNIYINDLIHNIMMLYYKEYKEILKEEGIMTKIEKNIQMMIRDFNLDKKWREEGKEEGLQIGIQQGMQQEYERSRIAREKQNMEIASRLLARGLTIEDVADITGLTKAQIKKLKK